MSIENLLSNVICDTFVKVCGKWQSKNENPKAFVVGFKTSLDYEAEEGYRYIYIALYGHYNYVSVFVKEKWNVIPLCDLDYDEETDETFIRDGRSYNIGESDWKRICHHDSCWRDAVQRFIFENRNKLLTFDSLTDDFYTLVNGKEFHEQK